MKRILSQFFLALLVHATLQAQYSWVPLGNVPGPSRSQAVSFTVNDLFYVGSGVDSNGTELQDFWVYNPATTNWTQIADFPEPRADMVAFTLSNTGYVGMGWDGSNNSYSSIYRYDSITNDWISIASYPGKGLRNSFVATAGGRAYIGGGAVNNNTPYFDDFYEYNPVFDSWAAIPVFPGGNRASGVSFGWGGKVYVFGGHDGSNDYKDFWEFDPATGIWTSLPDKPGSNLVRPMGFGFNNKGFIGLGNPLSTGTETDSVYYFDFLSQTWNVGPNYLGGPRAAAVQATGDSKVYVGTGRNGNNDPQSDFYKLVSDSVTSVMEQAEFILNIFPNPAKDFVWIQSADLSGQSMNLELYHSDGTLLLKQEARHFSSSTRLDFTGLSSGTYILKIQADTQVYYQKVLIQR